MAWRGRNRPGARPRMRSAPTACSAMSGSGAGTMLTPPATVTTARSAAVGGRTSPGVFGHRSGGAVHPTQSWRTSDSVSPGAPSAVPADRRPRDGPQYATANEQASGDSCPSAGPHSASCWMAAAVNRGLLTIIGRGSPVVGTSTSATRRTDFHGLLASPAGERRMGGDPAQARNLRPAPGRPATRGHRDHSADTREQDRLVRWHALAAAHGGERGDVHRPAGTPGPDRA